MKLRSDVKIVYFQKISSKKKTPDKQSGKEGLYGPKKDSAKTIFCPVCARIVALENAVGGLCRDCFNND